LGASKGRKGRTRFVSFLREFTTGAQTLRIGDFPVFSAHSWLYCRPEFGYQAAAWCHAPAVIHTEGAG
jgi:hypothetical protein